jgi:hypothetical protein
MSSWTGFLRGPVSTVEGRVSPILTGLDRCDWPDCDARAYARGLFEPLHEGQKTAYLNACGHHFRVVPMSFHEQAYHVIDETDEIR